MSYATNKVEKMYGKMSAAANISEANPHRIIQMLLEGALDKIAIAKGHLKQENFSESSRHITWAVSIIEGLRMSLDLSQGEIAKNLDALYDYMIRRLLDANLEKDPKALREVSKLLKEIKEGWDGIADSEAP